MVLDAADASKAYSALVEALVQRRRRLGLSRDVVGDLLGMPPGELGRLEEGKRRAAVPVLLMWAHVLGLGLRLAAGARLPRVTASAIEQRGAMARRMSAREAGGRAA